MELASHKQFGRCGYYTVEQAQVISKQLKHHDISHFNAHTYTHIHHRVEK